ncbi:hypothetical protein M3Y97_00644500 [Aphelenchoides bicaudatus]|nr:hypothetical protein M3Y97_00644500 [Aphelenchoides bicaudatus]
MVSRYPDPANPFVWNEHHYFENVTNLPYYKTNGYIVHASFNMAAFLIGTFLTCLMAYCIVTKTPVNFRPYSKILWLSIATDTMALVINLLFQTRLKVVQGTILLHISGPIGFLPFSWLSSLAFIQDFPCLIGSPILVFQFYFRYITLKTPNVNNSSKQTHLKHAKTENNSRKESPSMCRTFAYFCLASSPLIPVCICSYLSYTPHFESIPQVDYAQYWFKENPVPTLIVGSISSWATRFHIGGIGVITFICYTATIIFARLSVKELIDQSTRMNQRSKHLQRQFSQILIAQSLTSLFTAILPLLIGALVFLSGVSVESMGLIIMSGATWYPALNPLNSLIFIVPYRRFCLRKMGFSVKRRNTIGAISAQQFSDWRSTSIP